jgi:tRNA(Ile)-lysidine synthase
MIQLEDLFEHALLEHGLTKGQVVIIGVSGGIDSMVLLHLAHRFGLNLVVAHVNYQLRKESDLEMQLVQNTAQSMGYEVLIRLAGKEMSDASIQAKAREIRRTWFTEIMKETGACHILLGHHANDQAETFILRILRGSGLQGLGAMKMQHGAWIRPLLNVKREQIQSWAEKEGISWCDDSSNATDAYLRNRIRHQIIPKLSDIHPQGLENLLKTVTRLNSERSVFNQFLEDFKNTAVELTESGFRIQKEKLLRFESPSPLVHALLAETGISYAFADHITQNLTSTEQVSFKVGAWMVHIDRMYLSVIKDINMVTGPFLDGVPSIQIKQLEKTSFNELIFNRFDAIIDVEKLQGEFYLRKWQNGDRFWPTGMSGSQLLSDYFTNHKFSAKEKEDQWILCSGNDIVWIVNQRVDRRFAANKDSQQLIRVRIKQAE